MRSGDTLDSIARNAFGDGKLWCGIADASGIETNSDLKVGQALTLPSRVAAMNNGAQSFAQHNPRQMVGDTTPHLPQPQSGGGGGGGGGCDSIGRILVVVAAMVVGVMHPNAVAAVAQAAGTSSGVAAGTTALATGAVGFTTAAVATPTAGALAAQAVGVATGIQEGFSWKQVALSALLGGIFSQLGGALLGKVCLQVEPYSEHGEAIWPEHRNPYCLWRPRASDPNERAKIPPTREALYQSEPKYQTRQMALKIPRIPAAPIRP